MPQKRKHFFDGRIFPVAFFFLNLFGEHGCDFFNRFFWQKCRPAKRLFRPSWFMGAVVSLFFINQHPTSSDKITQALFCQDEEGGDWVEEREWVGLTLGGNKGPK